MLQIDRLYFLQYMMLLPAKWRCPLSDYYMKMVDTETGKAFVLKDSGKPAAYAVLVKENQGWILKYIYTAEDKRRKGYASYLIREIIKQSEQYVRVHIVQSHPFFKALANCLNKLGFEVNDTSCVYAVEVGESLWKRMDEIRLVRLKELLLRGENECIPFCKMDDGIRNQLVNSAENSFSNTLDPAPLMQNSGENIDTLISSVLVKNGVLKAYTLITRPAPNAVSVEHISEAQDKIGSGIIVAPLCASLEEIRRTPEITMMKLTISDKNTRSYRFVTKLMKGLEITPTKNISYIITAETINSDMI
ncbi:MAG: GNAT family N-acetyltransferase [Ruminiclostridium sp.]